MFVVMAVNATEAEILGVKSHILAEGMTPYDHEGANRVVIAVVGDVGPRKDVLMSRLGALPGVETDATGHGCGFRVLDMSGSTQLYRPRLLSPLRGAI